MTLGFLNVCIYLQAICDARRRFVFVSMDMPGATHDSRAFSFSALWAALQMGLLISGYDILGDDAYRGTSQILKPYIGNVSTEESVFPPLFASRLGVTRQGCHHIHEMIVIANRTCVLLAREDMITQRINAHLARAKRATVSVGKHLGDGRSETPIEKSLPNIWWETSYRLLLGKV